MAVGAGVGVGVGVGVGAGVGVISGRVQEANSGVVQAVAAQLSREVARRACGVGPIRVACAGRPSWAGQRAAGEGGGRQAGDTASTAGARRLREAARREGHGPLELARRRPRYGGGRGRQDG